MHAPPSCACQARILPPDQREYNWPALEDPHTRREHHPENQDLPDCQGKIQERSAQIRPYQRHSMRVGQSDRPAEESRGTLREAAAGRPRADAACFLITDQVSGALRPRPMPGLPAAAPPVPRAAPPPQLPSRSHRVPGCDLDDGRTRVALGRPWPSREPGAETIPAAFCWRSIGL